MRSHNIIITINIDEFDEEQYDEMGAKNKATMAIDKRTWDTESDGGGIRSEDNITTVKVKEKNKIRGLLSYLQSHNIIENDIKI